MAKHDSNTIIKFDVDTTVVDLITDETAYRKVRDLAVWCQDNNLCLNVSKTKEMILDYRKRRGEHATIHIDGAVGNNGREFQGPLSRHHQQTIMVQTHQDSREEGTTAPFGPQETEKIWHGSPDPQNLLQLHHQEHPDLLHHRLLWQLLCIQP